MRASESVVPSGLYFVSIELQGRRAVRLPLATFAARLRRSFLVVRLLDQFRRMR